MILRAVGCSHPSMYIDGAVWRCTQCHNVMGPVNRLAGSCPPHGSTVQRADGHWYCTVCGAQVW